MWTSDDYIQIWFVFNFANWTNTKINNSSCFETISYPVYTKKMCSSVTQQENILIRSVFFIGIFSLPFNISSSFMKINKKNKLAAFRSKVKYVWIIKRLVTFYFEIRIFLHNYIVINSVLEGDYECMNHDSEEEEKE